MKRILILAVALLQLSPLPLAFASGGSEIGNSKWVEDAPKPLPSNPTAGQKSGVAESIALFADASSLDIQAGETLKVKVLVPTSIDKNERVIECGGALSSPDLLNTRLLFDRCQATRVYSNVMELTLEYAFPSLTVPRSYLVQEVSWRTGAPSTMRRAQVQMSPMVRVQTRVQLPELAVGNASLLLPSKDRQTVHPGEIFEVRFQLQSIAELSNAQLGLRIDYAASREFRDEPVLPGARPSRWLAGVDREGDTLSIRIRVPADAGDIRHIEIGTLTVFNEALQEGVFTPRAGLGVDVRAASSAGSR